MTPENMRLIYGLDVVLPDYTDVEEEEEPHLKDDSSYDLWTVIYDYLCCGGGYPWDWRQFYYKIPVHRIKMFWELYQEKMQKANEKDGTPINMNHLGIQLTVSMLLKAFEKFIPR